jgi:23S rRNA pseudouridine1911/1915/1917 synthase
LARPLEVLFEDNHLLVVNKPAGVLTMGDRTGDGTLVELAKQYLKTKYHKPADVFLGVVHRLDRPVSGIVIFARTSKAAARLSTQFRERSIEKTYLALVDGIVMQPAGTLRHWLVKNRDSNRVSVVADDVREAREGVLDFRLIRIVGARTLLEIQPQTGRSHQIRVQLAAQDWPIVGDVKYGSKSAWPGGIALHAHRIAFDHPTRSERITVEAQSPFGA